VDKSSCGGEDFFAVSKRRSWFCIVNTKKEIASKLLEMRIEQQGSSKLRQVVILTTRATNTKHNKEIRTVVASI